MMKEAKELLASAELAFNAENKMDKLVMQCIYRRQYDIQEINQMLQACNHATLGNYE